MALKTEYIMKNVSSQAAPSDVQFSSFFTDHYEEISERYPVFHELFGYAKMVGLAKYLKEQGVPLFWFLMANKDLVITEDSIGTVDELAKGSEHFRGMEIRGGVDLGFQGNYVYDETALQAISEAQSKYTSSSKNRQNRLTVQIDTQSGAAPVSFKTGQGNYTVVPQHSLTPGKDRRGIRYQTDFSLRKDGKPSLEVVRYFNPHEREQGVFGDGWDLLIPYQVKPANLEKIDFRNAVIPKTMAIANLITGMKEVLTFSDERYTIAGYVPDKIEESLR